MFNDFPDIPEFLKVANRKPLSAEDAERVKAAMAATKPPCRRRSRRQRFDLPRSIEPVGAALLKQIEQTKAEKQKAKFRALRERSR